MVMLTWLTVTFTCTLFILFKFNTRLGTEMFLVKVSENM